jgi:hypothetical protein
MTLDKNQYGNNAKMVLGERRWHIRRLFAAGLLNDLRLTDRRKA